MNDFLPQSKKYTAFECCFNGRPAVKDVIESEGVPHTEVALILIDSEIKGLSTNLKGGERVSVYPFFSNMPVENQFDVLPFQSAELRFVADTHLGKLARYLRMAGFDTWYSHDCQDERLADLAAHETRILLTRDVGLLKRSQVVYGHWVRNLTPVEQMREVVRRYALEKSFKPFTRCLVCNEPVHPVNKQTILHRLPERVQEYCEVFTMCRNCNRIYWPGSHYENMLKFLSIFDKSP